MSGAEVFDFELGDVFQIHEDSWNEFGGGPPTIITDTVLTKTINGSVEVYTIQRWTVTYQFYGPPFISSNQYSITTSTGDIPAPQFVADNTCAEVLDTLHPDPSIPDRVAWWHSLAEGCGWPTSLSWVIQGCGGPYYIASYEPGVGMEHRLAYYHKGIEEFGSFWQLPVGIAQVDVPNKS